MAIEERERGRNHNFYCKSFFRLSQTLPAKIGCACRGRVCSNPEEVERWCLEVAHDTAVRSIQGSNDACSEISVIQTYFWHWNG